MFLHAVIIINIFNVFRKFLLVAVLFLRNRIVNIFYFILIIFSFYKISLTLFFQLVNGNLTFKFKKDANE